MKLRHLLALLLVWPVMVTAEIYKSVDADGHVTYSSAPIKGGKRIFLDPVSTYPAPSERSRRSEESNNFPRVDGVTQRSRDDTRRQILQEELSTEENLLEEARRNLKDGEAAPEVYKGKDGKTYRNIAKYQEKIKALNDQIAMHQRNVEALNTELSRLK